MSIAREEESFATSTETAVVVLRGEGEDAAADAAASAESASSAAFFDADNRVGAGLGGGKDISPEPASHRRERERRQHRLAEQLPLRREAREAQRASGPARARDEVEAAHLFRHLVELRGPREHRRRGGRVGDDDVVLLDAPEGEQRGPPGVASPPLPHQHVAVKVALDPGVALEHASQRAADDLGERSGAWSRDTEPGEGARPPREGRGEREEREGGRGAEGRGDDGDGEGQEDLGTKEGGRRRRRRHAVEEDANQNTFFSNCRAETSEDGLPFCIRDQWL